MELGNIIDLVLGFLKGSSYALGIIFWTFVSSIYAGIVINLPAKGSTMRVKDLERQLDLKGSYNEKLKEEKDEIEEELDDALTMISDIIYNSGDIQILEKVVTRDSIEYTSIKEVDLKIQQYYYPICIPAFNSKDVTISLEKELIVKTILKSGELHYYLSKEGKVFIKSDKAENYFVFIEESDYILEFFEKEFIKEKPMEIMI